MRRLVVIACVAMASAAGCSLVTDLSLLGDGGIDAAADGAITDVWTTDSPSDGRVDADASCGHTFCDDFDNETIAFEKWDKHSVAGGQIALAADAVTAPNALAVTIGSGSASAGPFVSKSFAKATTIHVEIDMKGNCSLPETDLVTFVAASPPAGYQEADLTFYQSPSSAHLALGYTLDGGANVADAGDLSLGLSFVAWKHYALDIDFQASTFSATTTDDAGTATKTLQISPVIAPTAFTLEVGVPSHSASGITCTVSFDDIVLDTQ